MLFFPAARDGISHLQASVLHQCWRKARAAAPRRISGGHDLRHADGGMVGRFRTLS